MFDAYNIRKIAPRMLLAVIGVNLSIYLCVAAVDITNVVGGGLASLIRGPFIETNTFESVDIDTGSGTGGKIATGAIVGLVGGGIGAAAGTGFLGAMLAKTFTLGAALAPLILMVVLLLILAGILIALAIMATVVIRYGAIILLTLVSPIAISMLVLPGTERYFQKWWEFFQKTLVVYPIIAAIFAISDVMGAIFLKAQGQEGGGSITDFVTIFVVIVVVYAPLFMIPFSFKLAGGFLGSVYDFANKNMYGRAKPRMDKWKEKEGGLYDRAKQRARKGQYKAGLTGHQIGEGALQAAGQLTGDLKRRRDQRRLMDEFNQFREQYRQKKRNGTLTPDDREKMADLTKRVHESGHFKGLSTLQRSRAGLIRDAATQYRKQSQSIGATYARTSGKEAREKDEAVKTLEGIDEAANAGKETIRHGEAAGSARLRADNKFQYDYLENGITDRERSERKANHDRVMGLIKRVNSQYGDKSAMMIHALNDHGSSASSSGTEVMNQDALEIAGGDTIEEARVLADLRAVAKEARRPDKAGLGISSDIELMSEAKRRIADGEAEVFVWRDIKQKKLEKSLARSSASEIVTAHPNAIKEMQDTIIDRVRNAADDKEREIALAQAANMYDAFQYAAPDNIAALDGLMSEPVEITKYDDTGNKVGTESMSTLKALEHMRGKLTQYADFAGNRRDFKQEEGIARQGDQQIGGQGPGAPQG